MVALAPSRLTGRMSHLLQGGVARPPPLAASGGTLNAFLSNVPRAGALVLPPYTPGPIRVSIWIESAPR